MIDESEEYFFGNWSKGCFYVMVERLVILFFTWMRKVKVFNEWGDVVEEIFS